MHTSNGSEELILTLGDGHRNISHEKLIKLNDGRVTQFLVVAVMYTMITLSTRQLPWCCGEVDAPRSFHLVAALRRWCNLSKEANKKSTKTSVVIILVLKYIAADCNILFCSFVLTQFIETVKWCRLIVIKCVCSWHRSCTWTRALQSWSQLNANSLSQVVNVCFQLLLIIHAH